MKISIITVGKIKEKYWKDAIAEYQKRLGRYCRLEIYEAADEKTPEECSERERLLILSKEAERMKKYIDPEAYTIALAIEGESLDSVQFSKKLEQLFLYGKSCIQFLIGGSLGMSPELLKQADYRLSFSAMTFPHQMMRVILLEQIYRACKIMKSEPYHK